MSEHMNDESNQDLKVDERESLKQRATIMGIQFQPNVPTDKLREMVNQQMQGNAASVGRIPANEDKKAKRARKRLEALALIRCRINCNDPAKKDWPGEYITVSNSSVGTIKKFIPYNTDAPYHIPKIMLNILREKKVQVFQTKPGKMGIPVRTSKMISAYNIEILPQLTEEELASLARDQSARRATDDSI